MAKLHMLIDNDGVVLGTALVESSGDDGPEEFGLSAGIGQTVVQVEVDDKLTDERVAKLYPAKLHTHIRDNFLRG